VPVGFYLLQGRDAFVVDPAEGKAAQRAREVVGSRTAVVVGWEATGLAACLDGETAERRLRAIQTDLGFLGQNQLSFESAAYRRDSEATRGRWMFSMRLPRSCAMRLSCFQ
jgi:hypothetical protein